MIEKIQKFFDKMALRVSLLNVIWAGITASGGLITAYLASVVHWLDSYGKLAWWIMGLLGALLTIWILAGFALLKQKWIMASASTKWKEQVSYFNPIDNEFNKLRIKVGDLVHPLRNKIKNKKFIACELLGPANLAFIGATSVSKVAFSNCDIVLVNDKTILHNVIGFEDVEIYGGAIMACTIFIPPYMEKTFREMPGGGNFVT